MPTRDVALRYMTRFQCIGSACEESCCSGGWSIFVDRKHYRALKRAMSRTPSEKAELAASVEPVPLPLRDESRHARLKLVDDSACTFLEADRLCSIYRRFGDEAVPNTCAIFPRHVSKIGERIELAGTLACPETARLALLADDAFELEPLDVATLPRPRASAEVKTSAGAYERCFDDVRHVVLELLGRR